jgi:hypothetical protein
MPDNADELALIAQEVGSEVIRAGAAILLDAVELFAEIAKLSTGS